MNLARGYRGGERQTETLVRALADRGIAQTLVARGDSPLLSRLEGVPRLSLRGIGKPYIMHVMALRGASLIHAHETQAAQFAYVSRLLGGPEYVITRRVPNVPKNRAFTRAMYGKARATVAISEAVRRGLQVRLPRLAVSVIPSMASQLPFDASTVRELRQRRPGRFRIGCVAALVDRHKGQACLLDAARSLSMRVPDLDFVLVGSGADEERFRREAADLSNVEFTGFKSNVGDYLASFDLFVLPSREEGLGSVLLDAMSFGLPIIATRVGGIPEVVEDGENGLLVPPADAAALADALERLYRDADLRRKFSENAVKMALRYHPSAISERYLSLYHAIVVGDECTRV